MGIRKPNRARRTLQTAGSRPEQDLGGGKLRSQPRSAECTTSHIRDGRRGGGISILWLPNDRKNGERTAQSAGRRRWAMQATANVAARAETRWMVRLLEPRMGGTERERHCSRSIGDPEGLLRIGTFVARAMKSKLAYAAYPCEVTTGRGQYCCHGVLALGLGLGIVLYLPTRALTPPEHSIVDVHEGVNAFWGSGWPAAAITDMG